MPSLSVPNTPSSHKPTRRTSLASEDGALARAIDRSLEIKCLRMKAFLNEHHDSLHLHVAQLRQFASSPGGLVLDEIRAIVWPVLAGCLVVDVSRSCEAETATSTASASTLSVDSDFVSVKSNFDDIDDDVDDASDGFSADNTDNIADDVTDDVIDDVTDVNGWHNNHHHHHHHHRHHHDVDGSDSPTSSKRTVLDRVSLDELKGHGEWNQVEMDVHRTLARFPPNISDGERLVLQRELTPLIVRVLWHSPRFRYYQGFHDVCLTLLLVLGVESAEKVALLLAKYGAFNGYLLRTLEESVLRDLDLMYVLMWQVDPELERIMRNAELGSLFALSWPLTWFSHALHHYRQIVLCFDLFLATHPLMPIYFTTAIVLWRSSSVMNTGRDMPSLHHLLNIMPNDVPIRAIAADAQDLFRMLPPSLVRGVLLDDYRRVLKKSSVKRPSLPTPSLRAWLVAGTATASIYLLSKYLFMSS